MSNDSAWTPGYIEGVGNVPGGPRERGGVSERERVVQISTGSTAVVPGVDHTPTIETRTFDDAPLDLASNDEPENWHEQDPAERLGRASTEIKLEEVEEHYDHTDFSTNYMNDFYATFAEYSRANAIFRYESNGSMRQRIHEIGRSQPDPAESAFRNRSRSPTIARRPSESHYNRSNPMFFSTESPTPERDSREDEAGSDEARLERRSGSTESRPRSDSPPSSYEDNEEQAANGCQCRVSYLCPHQSADQLDCGELVPERPMTYAERKDQEAWDREKMERAGSQDERHTTEADLIKICAIIDQFEKSGRSSQERQVGQIRLWIFEMEDITLGEPSQQTVATERVVPRLRQFLSAENQNVRRSGRVPTFIEEELTVLCCKWGRGDFSGDPRRGLTAVETVDANDTTVRVRYNLDKGYKFYIDARFIGAGSLVNGQLWNSRVELMRDGVHAARIGGISGNVSSGAYSIVMGEYSPKKKQTYANVDMGDVIEYMGTALPTPKTSEHDPTNVADPNMGNTDSWNHEGAQSPTNATRTLMKSLETGQPVRVIRSWKMSKQVTNKPRKGYRYDGLYRVVRKTAMKQERQIWSFRLERLEGQGRLRGFARHEDFPPSDGRRKGHFIRIRGQLS